MTHEFDVICASAGQAQSNGTVAEPFERAFDNHKEFGVCAIAQDDEPSPRRLQRRTDALEISLAEAAGMQA
jgi:hypothetical protein